MHYAHLISDTAGESHWLDVDVPLIERSFAPPAKAIEISDTDPATGMVFLRLKAGWDEPPHPTPVAQTLICVQGAVLVTASDGDTRVIGPGDIWRMEDTGGKGHHTCVTSAEDFLCVIVQHP